MGSLAALDVTAPVITRVQPLILLSGVPATGKTTFGRWLASQHGFLNADVEHRELGPMGLQATWDTALTTRDPRPLVSALTALGRPVVLDWGYRPSSLPVVQSLHDAGLTAWWFDGDRAAARRQFIKRDTIPVITLDAQMANIDRAWPDLDAFYGDRMVHTLDADGRFVPCEAVYERIISRAGHA